MGDARRAYGLQRVVRDYPYRDVEGRLIYTVRRTTWPPMGRRELWYLLPDDPTPRERLPAGVRRILYNSHLLPKRPGESVVIIAGERRADIIRSKGILGLSNGSPERVFRLNLADLEGRRVMLWAHSECNQTNILRDLLETQHGIGAEIVGPKSRRLPDQLRSVVEQLSFRRHFPHLVREQRKR